jgi:putative heme iron utilization protein
MTQQDGIIATLEEAVGFTETSLIVRTSAAIVEMKGPLKVQQGQEWLTLGEDSGSHVHLKTEAVDRIRYTHPPDANAALEVRNADGDLVCRISFRGTNPAQGDRFNSERAVDVRMRFARWAEQAGP